MAEVKKGGSTASVSAADKPANVRPAAGFDPSGAPQQVVPDIDTSHPAVDNDPRAGTTVGQNQIDFNDPRKPDAEVVAEQLGMNVASDKAKG